MAGREHDARGGVQVAHREGERGNRLDARIEVDVHAVGGKHAGGDALEVLTLEARVARDGDGRVVVVGVEVVGNALGGLGDDVDVHPVGAHAQNAAQASRAEGEIAVEGIVEGLLVTICDQGFELLLEVGFGDVLAPEFDALGNLGVHVIPLRRTFSIGLRADPASVTIGFPGRRSRDATRGSRTLPSYP